MLHLLKGGSQLFLRGHENLLAAGFAIDQDDLEQVLEPAAKVLDELLLELGSGSPGAGLDRGDVVLRNAEVVGQLALGQALRLPHRLEADSANLDFHVALLFDANRALDPSHELIPVRARSTEDLRGIQPNRCRWRVGAEALLIHTFLGDDGPELNKAFRPGFKV